jgi:hypothetical protein
MSFATGDESDESDDTRDLTDVHDVLGFVVRDSVDLRFAEHVAALTTYTAYSAYAPEVVVGPRRSARLASLVTNDTAVRCNVPDVAAPRTGKALLLERSPSRRTASK